MTPLNALATRWPALNALIDEALALPVPERAGWLESLAGERAAFRDTLRELLAAHARVETGDFLGILPKLTFAPDGVGGAIGVGALAAGERVGPYRLVSELGSGGMGAVWLAERADGAFEREVALKLPLINRLRQDLAVRFARERDILARLEHAHIARFYDAGITSDGLPYLAMEFVDGQPIGEYCDTRQLDVQARLRRFAQVLDAVQFAHANLVVHRDLKPSNILVTADGDVRLLDFGIAKLLAGDGPTHETQLTQASGRALTPHYASPEQVMGEPLTIASDVYSLGVVLCELLVGQRPYRLTIESAAQLEQAIVCADPAKPSNLVSDAAARARGVTAKRLARTLAGDLDTIVLKALAKSPAQRYATVAEFADDLLRHLGGQVVHARPASWRYRARKFVARNRLAVGAATAMGLALMTAALVSLGQAQVARAQAQRAEEAKTFVLSLLGDADVARGGSRQTTAVDLLKQARERLRAASITDNAIQVELLTTIGSGLYGLGELELSEPVLAEAARLAVAALGDRHARTAEARLAHGFVLLKRGESQAAAQQFDAVEAHSRRVGNSIGLAAALRGKSALHESQARYESAVDLATEAVRTAEQRLPMVDKRALIAAHSRLSYATAYSGRKGALEPARRAYTLAREVFGDRPTALLLEAQTAYLSALAGEGDAWAALPEAKAVLRQQAEMLGADHLEVAHSLRRVGIMSLRLGDPVVAMDSFREALRICQSQSAGKPTADIALTSLLFGTVLANAHRYDEALTMWHLADLTYSAFSDPEHYGARGARSGMAFALTKLGRLDEADAVFAALFERPFKSADEEAITKGRLGQLRSAQGRHDEALALLQDAPASFANAPSTGQDRQRALMLSELGHVLVAGGRDAEALDALQRARALLLKSLRHGSPDLADIAMDTARAQLALGRADEAVLASEAAVAYWERFDPASRSTGLAWLWHARALNATGNAQKAADALRRTWALLGGTGPPAERVLAQRTQREIAASLQKARRG